MIDKPPPRPAADPFLTPVQYDEGELTIAQNLGVSLPRPRLQARQPAQRQGRTQPPRPRPAPAPNPIDLANARAETQADTERRWSARSFTPEQTEAWLAAKLGPRDDAIAEACVRVGLKPEHLTIRVEGRTVVSRLRGGESADLVVTLMTAAGSWPPS